jgi:hypothetical protein
LVFRHIDRWVERRKEDASVFCKEWFVGMVWFREKWSVGIYRESFWKLEDKWVKEK